MWSVDIGDPHVPSTWEESGLWTFTKGDDMDPAVIAAQPGAVEVLFLDADPHSYDQTLAELVRYVPRVRHGGVVLVHDTKYEPEQSFPVARALTTFCEKARLSWEELGGEYGLGRITIPA